MLKAWDRKRKNNFIVVMKGQVKELDLRNIGMHENMMTRMGQNIIVLPSSEKLKEIKEKNDHI